ncbi:hypothetical protein A2704_01045 [Candidatus Kaiserbacteria bacterium RIFCSPHIGHO2_01_FULL_54_36b]|uniref:Uncharacterized protein n=1 Tax=Candidatus Kaiserbacteria bacterium RIFCSPHIGHO2_01_FULL_54_36b TaxID=1798483 RepID=A0A1F6CL79_9BACT|nr:MAG: hypothetical protein A2704_01045 [Candidatus Kaiserbacteria bacterium RIFCSPHIGHO2_01_FULL_54_36b]
MKEIFSNTKGSVSVALVSVAVFLFSFGVALWSYSVSSDHSQDAVSYAKDGYDGSEGEDEGDDGEDEDEDEEKDEKKDDDKDKQDDEKSDEKSESSGTSKVTKTSSAEEKKTDGYDAYSNDGAENENEIEDGENDDGEGDDLYDDYDGKNFVSDESGTKKSREFVANSDGTITEIRRETSSNGKVKVRYVTRDANGNKLEDRRGEYDPKEGEEKVRIKTYDQFGNKLSDLEMETKDGKKLEIQLKEGEQDVAHVKYDVDDEELEIRTGNSDFAMADEDVLTENSVKIRAMGDQFLITRKGIGVKANFPITVDNATGKIFVKTPVGNVELAAMPDTIVEKAKAAQGVDVVEDVSLASDDKSVEYVVSGTRFERLLGLFTIDIPSQTHFDAQTGDFVQSDGPFFSKILDLFSF